MLSWGLFTKKVPGSRWLLDILYESYLKSRYLLLCKYQRYRATIANLAATCQQMACGLEINRNADANQSQYHTNDQNGVLNLTVNLELFVLNRNKADNQS